MDGKRRVGISVLGVLDVRVDGVPVPIPGAKPRAILTLLGLNPGRVISADALAAALWGEDVPRTAAKALLTHISVLRRVLGDDVIETRGNGWRLAVPGTDASEFEASATGGRRALDGGAADEAERLFSAALGLWRGAPELPPTPRATAELTLWTESYESVRDDRVDALLTCGQAAELIGQLEAAVADAPLRERRWAQLCLALYRAGRQGDALQAYQRARTVMADELGVDPGPELRRLESAILVHDPALDARDRVGADLPRRVSRIPAEVAAAVPATPTPFIGRANELAHVSDLLARHRMVTVTGLGGVGKTRLALAVAAACWPDFDGHVTFVDLVPATEVFVVQAVAAALSIDEKLNTPLIDAVVERLAGHRWLLVLDNCEHVVEAAGTLAARLLAATPSATVLATSRERLGVNGEHVFAVPPMSLVGPGTGGPKGSDAEALFLDRARAIEPEFDADPDEIGQLCERLDGLPLAIELAAARCASLGIDGLLAALDDRLGLLTGARGPDDRHNSLRAMLEWSHDLLGESERVVFRRVGVFVGGFDLAAAAAVTNGAVDGPKLVDTIGRLVDKNLLIHDRGPTGSRWQLLAVVRQYALEHLTGTAEAALVGTAYVRWAAATAEQLGRRLETGETWRDRFDLVADDLRSAVLSPAAEDDPDRALALALSLARLYERRGAFTIAESTYAIAMSLARQTGQSDQVARAALGASMSGMLFGVALARRAEILHEALAVQPPGPSELRVRLSARLSTELYWSDDRERSLALAREAVSAAEALDDDGALAHALYALHYVTRGPQSIGSRTELPERIMRLARASGQTQLELAGRAAYIVGLLESGELERINPVLDELVGPANRLDHPEFQWYAAVYQLVRALIVGDFGAADELAATAADAARHAPEFSIGLFFAEAITDLRTLAGPAHAQRLRSLEEMADRYPHVFIWRCLATLAAVSTRQPRRLPADAERLAARLLNEKVQDGHWLVGCCLLAEAVAIVGDRTLAADLRTALRPYAGRIAVAGRVAAFRGSTSHALGLLGLTLAEPAAAVTDLEQANEQHAEMGARPFQARSLTALAEALEACGRPGDADRAAAVREQAERLSTETGITPGDSSAGQHGRV